MKKFTDIYIYIPNQQNQGRRNYLVSSTLTRKEAINI